MRGPTPGGPQITAWVEKSTVPTSVVINSADASASQLLCPYPSKPVYGGTGTITAAANYSCK